MIKQRLLPLLVSLLTMWLLGLVTAAVYYDWRSKQQSEVCTRNLVESSRRLDEAFAGSSNETVLRCDCRRKP